MKIAICGSMAFAEDMKLAKEVLEKKGHKVFTPEFMDAFINIKELELRAKASKRGSEGAKLKVEHDLIRKHWYKIKNSDAILVLNHTKNGVRNYIGGNSFLEMGFAHILNKRIFLMNPIPSMPFIREEILAMEPTVLNGNLSKIK